jgi:hypothetical protein
MQMKIGTILFLAGLLSAAPVTLLAGDSHKWQTGKLTETEQQKIPEGSTRTSNTDATVKDKGNRTDYSRNTTTTTTDNMETYQFYTIESGNKIYVASEHLLFPWSKPANIQLGEPVKFAVEKGKIFIQDDDGKEHKATLVKTSLKSGG